MENALQCYVKYTFPNGSIEFIFNNGLNETEIKILNQLLRVESIIILEKWILPNHLNSQIIFEFMKNKENTLGLREFIFQNCK